MTDSHSDSGPEVDPLTSSSAALPPAEVVQQRRLGSCGRLRAELALLGRMVAASLVAWSLAGAWVVVACGERGAPALVLARLAVPQFIAVAAVALRTVVDLPAARWDRRGHASKPGLPWSFIAVGWLLWPVALVLWIRDRAARRVPVGDEAIAGAHARLARVPYAVALRFFAWSAIAFAVDLVLLASERPLSRAQELALLLAWWGGLAAVSSWLANLGRDCLRPELLTVPLHPSVRVRVDLRVRQLALALPAGLGLVIATAAVATLARDAVAQQHAVAHARALAEDTRALLDAGDERGLGRMLARTPGLGVDDGQRRLGRAASCRKRTAPTTPTTTASMISTSSTTASARSP
ncbi:MAG: hypothetical protein IPN32_36775 [Deltaproteobacteria bacterium]|nr:hypothetical protein [Deltaproteobacteria bacterium]